LLFFDGRNLENLQVFCQPPPPEPAFTTVPFQRSFDPCLGFSESEGVVGPLVVVFGYVWIPLDPWGWYIYPTFLHRNQPEFI